MAAIDLVEETSVEVTGSVVSDPRAPGGYELRADFWRVIGPSPEEYTTLMNIVRFLVSFHLLQSILFLAVVCLHRIFSL